MDFLLRIFHPCSSQILAYNFLFFCWVLVWFQYQGNSGFLKIIWKCSLKFNLIELFEEYCVSSSLKIWQNSVQKPFDSGLFQFEKFKLLHLSHWMLWVNLNYLFYLYLALMGHIYVIYIYICYIYIYSFFLIFQFIEYDFLNYLLITLNLLYVYCNILIYFLTLLIWIFSNFVFINLAEGLSILFNHFTHPN